MHYGSDYISSTNSIYLRREIGYSVGGLYPPPEQLTRLNEVVAIPIRKARELLANMEKDTTIQTYVYGLEYAGVTRLLLVNPQCSIPKETILEESRKAMNANPFVLYTNETAGKALLKAFNSLMET